MPGIKVFVSVGRTSIPAQEEFVSAVEKHMLEHGLEPLALGRNYWSSQQPLRAVDDLMTQCSGAAIVAFERLRIVHGVDRRGSELQRDVTDIALPTVWNQIEAAMAYSRGLPLLVLVQEELRTEGLLETGYDWYVKRMPLAARATTDREFCGIFDDWRSRVETHHAGRRQGARREVTDLGSSPTLESRAESKAESKAESRPAPSRRELRKLLETGFNDDELRGLCFDLSLDYENLPGTTKAAKAVEIVKYFERTNRLQELIRSVADLRPGAV